MDEAQKYALVNQLVLYRKYMGGYESNVQFPQRDQSAGRPVSGEDFARIPGYKKERYHGGSDNYPGVDAGTAKEHIEMATPDYSVVSKSMEARMSSHFLRCTERDQRSMVENRLSFLNRDRKKLDQLQRLADWRPSLAMDENLASGDYDWEASNKISSFESALNRGQLDESGFDQYRKLREQQQQANQQMLDIMMDLLKNGRAQDQHPTLSAWENPRAWSTPEIGMGSVSAKKRESWKTMDEEQLEQQRQNYFNAAEIIRQNASVSGMDGFALKRTEVTSDANLRLRYATALGEDVQTGEKFSPVDTPDMETIAHLNQEYLSWLDSALVELDELIEQRRQERQPSNYHRPAA